MKLEVDLKLLSETGLTPDDYVFLYIIWRKGFGYVDSVSFRIKATRLQDDGWITLNDERDHTKFIVQQKFKDLFVSDVDKMFEELVDLYPHKVLSSRGERILRAKDPNSMSNKKAKNKYKRIVLNKPYLHRYIVSCLKKQLAHEQDNLGYMQNFETWINNHTWEKYADINPIKNVGDGRQTRQL